MKTIYVVGSGPTLDYINPMFFKGETVIAVNSVGDRLGMYSMPINLHTYSHYHSGLLDLATKYPGHSFYGPEGDRGFAGKPPVSPDNITYFPHYPTHFDFDPRVKWPEGGILMGSTTVHGAMHLACKMGAENIMLVGVDCGLLDSKTNHGEYVSGNLADGDVLDWLARWNDHLIAVKEVLIEEYGVSVHSLNPFVNLNLEGHSWTAAKSKRVSRLCKVCGMDCADLHL